MEVEQMLKEVKAISDKYDLLYKKTGGYFNIFEITNTAYKEVVICRVIHELISPKGSHCQGDLYLRMFIRDVLQIDTGTSKDEISEEEIKTAEVIREYLIKDDRRIDLVVKTHSIFIPIEVKIFAEDQPKQCYDYYHYSKNRKLDKTSNVFYLTRFGDNPSEESAGKLTLIKNDNNDEISYKEVTCISFATDILNWLDNCLKHTNTIQIAPIREVILQLMTVIRKFTGKLEKNKEIEMKGLLNSAEKMKSAIEISKSINEAKRDLIIDIFKKVEKRVKQDKLVNEMDYEWDNLKRVDEYCYRNKQTWPAINYLYKKDAKHNVDIWVRMELADDIFIGYCCPLDGKSDEAQFSEQEVNSVLGKPLTGKGWWMYTEYLPNNCEKDTPRFRSQNEAFTQLFDSDNFENYVQKCADKINEFLHIKSDGESK